MVVVMFLVVGDYFGGCDGGGVCDNCGCGCVCDGFSTYCSEHMVLFNEALSRPSNSLK